MAKRASKTSAPKEQGATLSGWKQIAAFLGQSESVVQRWAAQGMPVRREGRLVTTNPGELSAWMGKESGKPVHVATEDTDLAAEMKRGLAFVRHAGTRTKQLKK